MSRIGIIAALPAEAKCLYRKNIDVATPVEIGQGIFLCLSGIGYTSASIATRKLLDLNMDAIISWGVAGALDEQLNSGDLLIADAIFGQNYNHVTSAEWVNRINAYCMKTSRKTVIGSIASIAEVCASAKDKYNLCQKTGALAVDMESAAITELAIVRNVDIVVLRAIADEADSGIPAAVINHTNNLGQPEPLPFILSCLKNPDQIKELIKLSICYKKALKTLRHGAPDLKKQHFLYNNQSIS